MQGSTPEHRRRTRAVLALASLGTQQVSVRTLLDAPRRRFQTHHALQMLGNPVMVVAGIVSAASVPDASVRLHRDGHLSPTLAFFAIKVNRPIALYRLFF
uniref:Uncharacterized protein n=1 Tax=Mantoniella antarctica TaxID=81844 RepID=A0A7S0SUP7_9CHLO